MQIFKTPNENENKFEECAEQKVNLDFYKLGFYERFKISLRYSISLKEEKTSVYEPRFLRTSLFINFILSPFEC